MDIPREIMEACEGVERDINNVVDKFSNLGESNHRILEEAIQLVRAAKDEIRDGEFLAQKPSKSSLRK